MKVLANDGISLSGEQTLKDAGFIVSTENVPQTELIEEINSKNIEVLLVRSATTVRTDLIDACPNLKIVGRGGVGMDNIDVDYARSKGINVMNTPAASSQSVAELVMAHLFGAVRSLYDSNRLMPVEGTTNFKLLKKKYAKGIELRGKTIGIVGFGRIGQSLAKYAIGCGMNVIACNKSSADFSLKLSIANQEISVNIPNVSLDEMLEQSDVISLHIPGGDKAVIGSAELNKMKDGVILLNAARGGVIDEDALLSALSSGKVAHAGIDVFVNEPNPREDILKQQNVSLSPHIGAATVEAQDRIGTELAEKIIAHYKL